MVMTQTKPVDSQKAMEYFEAEMMFTTGPVELDRRRKEDPSSIVIVDVRAAEDYQKGHVPGAINLPAEQWQNLEKLSKDKTNVLYCYSVVCHLAKKAAVEFSRKGYPVMEMDGGFDSWKEYQLEVERS